MEVVVTENIELIFCRDMRMPSNVMNNWLISIVLEEIAKWSKAIDNENGEPQIYWHNSLEILMDIINLLAFITCN